AQADRSMRAFEVDLSRIPEESLSSASTTDFSFSDVGRQLSEKTITTLKQFEAAVSESKEVRFAPGTDVAARSVIFRELKALVRSTVFDVRAQHLAAAITSGLRVKPSEGAGGVVVGDIPTEAIIREVPHGPIFASSRVPGSKRGTTADMEERILLSGGTLLNGKEYLAENHTPGTVVILQSSVSNYTRRDLQRLKRIQKLYEGWMRKFNMKTQRLTIYGNELGGVGRNALIVGEAFGTSGQLSAYGTDAGIIGIDLTRKETQHLGTVTHEFGHFIGFTELVKEDASFVDLIVSAYNRSLVKGGLSTARAFGETFLSPQRLLGSAVTKDIPLGETEFGENTEYWLGFDEWFAD
ncbi:hypothetical protein LCGC14_3059690, partial [marine sediment metagenome]